MKYTIGLTRLAIVHAEIEVEADTPEEAAQEACAIAKTDGGSWTFDDVYDDGKPHCMISANTCTDEDGEGHDVEEEIMP